MKREERKEIEILVTENRSVGHPGWVLRNVVRVFVNRDLSYGYWVPEDALIDLLSENQKIQYFNDSSYSGGKFIVPIDTAREIIRIGQTPYNKQVL